MHFFKFIGGDVVRHVRIGNSNPGRKLQFVVLDLQFFGVLKRVLGPMPRALLQESLFL